MVPKEYIPQLRSLYPNWHGPGQKCGKSNLDAEFFTEGRQDP